MEKEIELNGDSIRRNLPYLCRNTTNISSLMDYLFAKDIISFNDKLNFMSKRSDEDRCSRLYIRLMEVVTNATFQKLIDGLKKTGNSHIADVLLLSTESANVKSSSVPCTKLAKWWPKKQVLIKSLIQRRTGELLIVQKLKELLHNNKDNTSVLGQMTAMAGMGGIGKSTTAKWFAHYYEDEYDHIIWLDCGEGNTEKSLRELAHEMKIKFTTYDKENRATHFVVEEVYWIIKSEKCLFIFDNVDCYTDVQRFLPTTGNKWHHCLITSRHQFWGNENKLDRIQVFQLDVYSEHDTEEFLQSALTNINKNGNEIGMRQKLATQMGYLPLALQIAVSTMNNMNWSISEYLEETMNSKDILFNEDTGSYQMSLKCSLEISIRVVEKNTRVKCALDILNVFAFIAPDAVEKNMLFGIFGKELKYNIEAGLKLLQDYSLITCSGFDNNIFNIHRLLQDFVRMRTKDSHVTLLSKLLNYFSRFSTTDKYSNHIESVWERAMKHDDVVDSFWKYFMEFVETQLQLSGRSEFLQAALPHLDRNIGAGDETTCTARHHIGYALFASGKYDECCKMWEFILTASSPTVSVAFPILILTAKYNLGVVYETQGNYKVAITFYNSVVMELKESWRLQNTNTFRVHVGSTIGDCKIQAYPKELQDTFATKLELECKIVTLLIILNDLDGAWTHMKSIMSMSNLLMFRLNPNFAIKNYIIVAGLKLLITTTKRSKLKAEGENNWKLFKYMSEKFIEWGKQHPDFMKLVYWNVLAGVADIISVELIEIQRQVDTITLFQMIHETFTLISLIEFKDSPEFQFPNLGSQTISQLNELGRNEEADRIGVIIEAIKTSYNQDRNQIEIEKITPYKENESSDKQFNCSNYNRFVSSGESELQNLTELDFDSEDINTGELCDKLKSCLEMTSIKLRGTNLWISEESSSNGDKSPDRVFLPKLKTFVLDEIAKEKEKKEQIDRSVDHINSILFFYKLADKPIWSIDEINQMDMESLKISIKGTVLIDITIDTLLYNLDGDVTTILKAFKPKRLSLQKCEAGCDSLNMEELEQLELKQVTFTNKTIINIHSLLSCNLEALTIEVSPHEENKNLSWSKPESNKERKETSFTTTCEIPSTKLPKLRKLELSNFQFSGQELFHLLNRAPNLTHFSFHNVKITNDCQDLVHLKELQEFSLHLREASDDKPCRNFDALKRYMFWYKVEETWENMDNLKALNKFKFSIAGKNIIEVTLKGGDVYFGLSHQMGFEMFENFSLSICNQESLTKIHLNQSRFSFDQLFESLKLYSGLKHLFLEGPDVTKWKYKRQKRELRLQCFTVKYNEIIEGDKQETMIEHCKSYLNTFHWSGMDVFKVIGGTETVIELNTLENIVIYRLKQDVDKILGGFNLLRKLTLQNCDVSLETITNFGDTLEDLSIENVTIQSRYDVPILEDLLKEFSKLKILKVHSMNEEEVSISLCDIPNSVTKCSLKNTEIIYTNSSRHLMLDTLSLEIVHLPLPSSPNFNLLFGACSNVFLYACDDIINVPGMIEAFLSLPRILLLCVAEIPWNKSSEGIPESIQVLQNFGLERNWKYFCLHRNTNNKHNSSDLKNDTFLATNLKRSDFDSFRAEALKSTDHSYTIFQQMFPEGSCAGRNTRPTMEDSKFVSNSDSTGSGQEENTSENHSDENDVSESVNERKRRKSHSDSQIPKEQSRLESNTTGSSDNKTKPVTAQLIKSNLIHLTEKTTNIPILMIYLITNDVITDSEKQHAEAKQTDMEKSYELYNCIMKKDEKKLLVLVDGWKYSGNTHLVDYLLAI